MKAVYIIIGFFLFILLLAFLIHRFIELRQEADAYKLVAKQAEKELLELKRKLEGK